MTRYLADVSLHDDRAFQSRSDQDATQMADHMHILGRVGRFGRFGRSLGTPDYHVTLRSNPLLCKTTHAMLSYGSYDIVMTEKVV